MKKDCYVCGICGEEFSWHQGLKEHMLTVHKGLEAKDIKRIDQLIAQRNRLEYQAGIVRPAELRRVLDRFKAPLGEEAHER